MPEHIFSGVDIVTEFDFNPPVGLGPYVLHSFDPNGAWYAWEKREDWDRTAIVEYGEPTPQSPSIEPTCRWTIGSSR